MIRRLMDVMRLVGYLRRAGEGLCGLEAGLEAER